MIQSMTVRMVLVFSLMAGATWFSGTWGCGGGGGGGGGDETTNALSGAYPSDLAVTSLTASSSSAAGLLAGLKSQATEAVIPQTFQERKEEMQGILNAENPTDLASHVNFDFNGAPPETTGCFGPNIYLKQDGGTGHPDGPIGTPPDFVQTLPPKDIGIYEETEDGEACIAVQLNKLMAQIDTFVRAGMDAPALTLAAGNLGGESLPAQGESKDLLEEVSDTLAQMEAAGGSMPIEFTEATLSREAEDQDGNPVYDTEVKGTVVLPDKEGAPGLKSQEAADSDVEIDLRHIPESEDNATYTGRLQQKISTSQTDNLNPNLVGCDGMTECISIAYQKTSATELRYHMRRAQFCGLDADCFDANGDVTTDTTVWAAEFYYTICNVNPEDGSGDCTQAWQAGHNDGNTRTFNVSVASDGTGCGYFGYGPAENASEGVGSIDGMICNWTGPGSEMFGSKTMTDNAQRQCFTRNAEGRFISDSETLAILYAPTKSCDKAENSFSFGNEDPPTDHPVGEVVNNELIDLTDVDFTMPALPVVP